MYILRESNQNVGVDQQKISGQYHLIGDAFHVALNYFGLDTDNPQARIAISGLDLGIQPYPEAIAEFGQIVDAAVAECKATKQSFLNLSDIETEKKAKATPKPAQTPKAEVQEPETPTETEAS
jgi:hypothetical protein